MTAAIALIPLMVFGAVVLRGGGETIEAPVIAVAPGGLSVGGDEPRMIGWDSILRVTGEQEGAAATYESLSDRSWRARLRLARGDVRMAGPLFETLYSEYSDSAGPTTLLIAEGAARCRLAAGRQFDAVGPWTTALALRRSGWKIAGDPPLEPVIDEATGLIPALGPFFLRDGTQSAATGEIEFSNSLQDVVANTLRQLYACAATGAPTPDRPAETRDHPGVELVSRILAAQVNEPKAREAARKWLEGYVNEHEASWREAWCRFAIGRSLLKSEDSMSRQRGIVEMLHVPARFHASLPYLAGLALEEAAQELDRSGDAVGAAVLRQELTTLLPNHPLAKESGSMSGGVRTNE